MNRTFDFYEFAGIIVPGAVLILGLLWLFPDMRPLFSKDGLSFGEFGVFVIIAYAAGQLVQGVGNLIELVFWKLLGGIPSTRALKHGTYLGPHQHKRMLDAVRNDFGVNPADITKDMTTMQLPVVREIYVAISDAKKSQRVDIFTGNYGLARGLCAAFFVLLVVEVGTLRSVIPAAILLVLFLLALQRMHRYGRHYATELVATFLTLRSKPAPAAD